MKFKQKRVSSKFIEIRLRFFKDAHDIKKLNSFLKWLIDEHYDKM